MGTRQLKSSVILVANEKDCRIRHGGSIYGVLMLCTATVKDLEDGNNDIHLKVETANWRKVHMDDFRVGISYMVA
jgi:hypothetical protein